MSRNQPHVTHTEGTPLLLPTSPQFLRLQGQRRGAHGGLRFAGTQVTYPELAASVDALAAWLTQRGLGGGDYVGVLAANEPALVVMLFAVWGIGAVAVPLGVRATADEVASRLIHARARALLCDRARGALAREAATAAGIAAFAGAAAAPVHPRILRRGVTRRRPPAPRTPGADTLAVLAYTSGTTAAPKAAMLTHANLLWSASACATARGDRAEGVGACLAPLTHTPVLVSHLLSRILLGATAVLFERFDVGTLLEALPRHGITDLPLVGGMLFDLLALKHIPAAVRRSVEKVSVGGATTPLAAKCRLARMFGRAEIIEAYGQSESTDGVTMTRGHSAIERPGTVGLVNPYVHVAVQRPDGSITAVEEEGEIVVSGPTVMSGYYRDNAGTAAALRNGWLHTGDLGYRDRDGFLFVSGRLKEIIISGGENVSPAEVEAALRAHPDIEDVAVIGTPHPRWGEQVTAVIVRRSGARIAPAALTDFAGKRLASFKTPRRIEFVDHLPRNAMNKVNSTVLRQTFASSSSPSPERVGVTAVR